MKSSSLKSDLIAGELERLMNTTCTTVSMLGQYDLNNSPRIRWIEVRQTRKNTREEWWDVECVRQFIVYSLKSSSQAVVLAGPVTLLLSVLEARCRLLVSIAPHNVQHTLLIVENGFDSVLGVPHTYSRMNIPRDQSQRGGPGAAASQMTNYYQPTAGDQRTQALDLASENTRFARSDQRLHSSSTNTLQNTGPHSAPPINPAPLPERTNIPTRASTMDHDRHIKVDQAEYGHHARSDDLNHGSSTRNMSSFNGPGSLPGPSPAFMNSSRPNTPPSSGQQQQNQAPQYQGSSSGHSERARRLSVASQSSVSSISKTNLTTSSSAATSVASS